MRIINPNTILAYLDVVYEPSTHIHYVIEAIIGQDVIMYPLTYWGRSSHQIRIPRSSMNDKLVLILIS